MDAIKKSQEIQLQVRHNAEEVRNTLKDLYSWEQEMKIKEKEVAQRSVPLEVEEANVPIRSHILAETKLTQTNKQQEKQLPNSISVARDDEKSTTTSSATTPSEKKDKPLDPNEEKRKQANEVKDKGNKYVKLGDYEKAINEYTTAIEIFPEDPVFYSNRALCHLKMERYNECIEDCERAIDIDRLSVKPYYRRMQANECLGNNMDALKDCTTVLMIEPKNSEAKKSLERINDRLRKNVKSTKGPSFSVSRDNIVDILPIDKPPYKRSNKPLRRVPISDVVGPKDSRNSEHSNLKISDEDIDKLFNSNCGPFVEVKKSNNGAVCKNEAIPVTKSVGKSERLNEVDKIPNKAYKKQKSQDNQETSTAEDANKSLTTYGKDVFLRNANRTLPPPPTSTAQFYSNWKELAPAHKYQYLKSIDVSQICKILGAGFDSDTLTDVLGTLRDFYLQNKDKTAAATLLEISKNSQVELLSLFMSADEKKIVTEILNSIREDKANTLAVEQITKNFNLQ